MGAWAFQTHSESLTQDHGVKALGYWWPLPPKQHQQTHDKDLFRKPAENICQNANCFALWHSDLLENPPFSSIIFPATIPHLVRGFRISNYMFDSHEFFFLNPIDIHSIYNIE